MIINDPEDRSALSGKLPPEMLRRRTDHVDGWSVTPTPMRTALAAALMAIHNSIEGQVRPQLKLAAEVLERDEQANAEMIDVLVRAGYKDVPARIDATVIRRLLGYITPV